ncbi:MAG TPA: hypothetical protein ENN65_00050, partial [Candidatus Hydrogenedentes bacterium]|nr:hypothetical protein [Candidatus Hydrogenedentota bacterium]
MRSSFLGKNGRSAMTMTAVILALLAPAGAAMASDAGDAIITNQVIMDTVWVMIAGFLVFWMNAGFAFVESGFCRSKNAVNILAKNFIVFAISCLT